MPAFSGSKKNFLYFRNKEDDIEKAKKEYHKALELHDVLREDAN